MKHVATQPPSSADIVIVGGGIQGLALAYNLSELGAGRIIVVDAGYFQGRAGVTSWWRSARRLQAASTRR